MPRCTSRSLIGASRLSGTHAATSIPASMSASASADCHEAMIGHTIHKVSSFSTLAGAPAARRSAVGSVASMPRGTYAARIRLDDAGSSSNSREPLRTAAARVIDRRTSSGSASR